MWKSHLVSSYILIHFFLQNTFKQLDFRGFCAKVRSPCHIFMQYDDKRPIWYLSMPSAVVSFIGRVMDRLEPSGYGFTTTQFPRFPEEYKFECHLSTAMRQSFCYWSLPLTRYFSFLDLSIVVTSYGTFSFVTDVNHCSAFVDWETTTLKRPHTCQLWEGPNVNFCAILVEYALFTVLSTVLKYLASDSTRIKTEDVSNRKSFLKFCSSYRSVFLPVQENIFDSKLE